MTVQSTSINAYNQIIDEGLVGQRQQEVLDKLLELKDQGEVEVTDQELSKSLGYADPNNVRPRRKELFDAGIIEVCASRKCTVTGRMVLTWKLASLPIIIKKDKRILCAHCDGRGYHVR